MEGQELLEDVLEEDEIKIKNFDFLCKICYNITIFCKILSLGQLGIAG